MGVREDSSSFRVDVSKPRFMASLPPLPSASIPFSYASLAAWYWTLLLAPRVVLAVVCLTCLPWPACLVVEAAVVLVVWAGVAHQVAKHIRVAHEILCHAGEHRVAHQGAQVAQNLMSNPDMLSNLMSNPRLRQMAENFGQGGGMPDNRVAHQGAQVGHTTSTTAASTTKHAGQGRQVRHT
jgi:hypothetical protein